YVYGNCASFHVLETAGVRQAKAMAIALPDPMSTRLSLRRGLELYPDLNIVVRATNNKNIEALYQLGAREVVQPEFEASLEMVSFLLTDVGFLVTTLQREMQEIRKRHYLDFRPEQSASEVARDLRRATADLNKRWYSLPTNSPLVGMTLEQADMRYLTGVSLMAIKRTNGQEIDYPDAKTSLEEGDKLLVVGSSEEIAALDEFASGKATVPGENSACQWVKLNNKSLVIGKTLGDLDIRQQYGVEIQAIRRERKFIRYPNNRTKLQNRDQLLLCGRLIALNQLEELFSPQIKQPVLSIPVVKAAELEGLREYLPLDELRE
ncbi:MAG: TrkA C-terminal domain-containing protein, partial [Cyanobacteria bacterium J06649_11]